MEYILAPSILAADFKNLGCEMKKTEENGAGVTTKGSHSM